MARPTKRAALEDVREARRWLNYATINLSDPGHGENLELALTSAKEGAEAAENAVTRLEELCAANGVEVIE